MAPKGRQANTAANKKAPAKNAAADATAKKTPAKRAQASKAPKENDQATTAPVDFATWDLENARTNPLEDFHYADTIRNMLELSAAERQKYIEALEYRGVGGTTPAERGGSRLGIKRPAESTEDAVSKKQKTNDGVNVTEQPGTSSAELVAASDSTMAGGEKETSPSSKQQTSNRKHTARKEGLRPDPVATVHKTATVPQPQRTTGEIQPDHFFIRKTDINAGEFTEVGPNLKSLSQRPLLAADTPDQFVFDKNLNKTTLYQPPYRYKSTERWWKVNEERWIKEGLRHRQLLEYKIIDINRRTNSNVLLDPNGRRLRDDVEPDSSICKEINKALDKYITFHENLNDDDEDIEETIKIFKQAVKRKTSEEKAGQKSGGNPGTTGRRRAENRFQKFLKLRTAIFEKYGYVADSDKHEETRQQPDQDTEMTDAPLGMDVNIARLDAGFAALLQQRRGRSIRLANRQQQLQRTVGYNVIEAEEREETERVIIPDA